jgi:hypothetical protein
MLVTMGSSSAAKLPRTDVIGGRKRGAGQRNSMARRKSKISRSRARPSRPPPAALGLESTSGGPTGGVSSTLRASARNAGTRSGPWRGLSSRGPTSLQTRRASAMKFILPRVFGPVPSARGLEPRKCLPRGSQSIRPAGSRTWRIPARTTSRCTASTPTDPDPPGASKHRHPRSSQAKPAASRAPEVAVVLCGRQHAA